MQSAVLPVMVACAGLGLLDGSTMPRTMPSDESFGQGRNWLSNAQLPQQQQQTLWEGARALPCPVLNMNTYSVYA